MQAIIYFQDFMRYRGFIRWVEIILQLFFNYFTKIFVENVIFMLWSNYDLHLYNEAH